MEFTCVSATATAACGGAASNHTSDQRSSSQESEAIRVCMDMEQKPAGGEDNCSVRFTHGCGTTNHNMDGWSDKILEADAHLALPYVKEPARLFTQKIDRAKAVEQNYRAIYT